MKLLVIGASRGVGLATCRRALDDGMAVRGLARSAGTMPDLGPGFEAVEADCLDEAAVRAALDGVDVVVQALGIPFDLRMLRGPVTLFSEATRVLIPAMQAASVRRLVCVTGFGAGNCEAAIPWFQKPGFKLVFGRAYADKSRQEAMIRDSDLSWCLARPGVLTNGSASGNYQVLVEPERWRNGIISRADVADFLVRQCAEDTWAGETPALVRIPL